MSHSIYLILFSFFSFVAVPVTGGLPAFTGSMRTVSQVPLPDGFERVPLAPGSFGAYLRNLPLRKDKTVYLYNGQPKQDQSLHYAVIDISTGDKDLQQCADAVMRLRAEYFFQKRMYDSIIFPRGNQPAYRFSNHLTRNAADPQKTFSRFMETVFINCGTYTLAQWLRPVTNYADMQPGNVFVKGGAPGHAEIVIDMAVNKQTGKKIFLLAESYMPAQDMHILVNPLSAAVSPWYELNGDKKIITATWVFEKTQLKKW